MWKRDKIEPSQPSFYQLEDLGTSDHDVQLLGYNCVNNSFPEPESRIIQKRKIIVS